MLDLKSKEKFLFDLDDTLINTTEANMTGLELAYKRLTSECEGDLTEYISLFQFKKDLEKLYRTKTKKKKLRKYFDYEPKVFEDYCNYVLPTKDNLITNHKEHSLAARLYWQFRQGKYDALMPKPNVVRIIKTLYPIADLYCVTQGKCNHQHTKIMLTNLEDLIAEVVVTKDKTVELAKYVRKRNFNLKLTVMIGDKQSDVQAGKNAHIDTVQIASKNQISKEKEQLKLEGTPWSKPDLTLRNMNELYKKIV